MQLVARLAADAFARVLTLGSTRYDGDLIFAITTGQVTAEAHRVGLLARGAMERALVRGVLEATAMGGLPGAGALEGA